MRERIDASASEFGNALEHADLFGGQAQYVRGALGLQTKLPHCLNKGGNLLDRERGHESLSKLAEVVTDALDRSGEPAECVADLRH